MTNDFYININQLQPSQLFINEKKLKSVQKWIDPKNHNYDAVPIKEFGEKIVLTDGHTRTLSVYMSGQSHIKVHWDHDELDTDLYLKCIDLCLHNNITSILDLKDRVLTDEDYTKKWINLCRSLEV